MLRLALRNVLRQRTRTALTLAAVALGVASLILAGGYVDDALTQLRESTIKSRLGHLQIYRAGLHDSGGQRPYDYLIEDVEPLRRVIHATPGVVVHARRLSFSGLASNGRGELPILGEGVEPDAESRIGSAVTMLRGRRLAGSDRFAIVLGEGVAVSLGVDVGSSVTLLLNTRGGAMNTLDFDVVGVFRSMSKEHDARAVQVPLSAAAELVDTRGVNAVVVLLGETSQTDRVRETLVARLPANRFEVKSWEELADFYAGAKAFYERQFAVLQGIILVMVLFSVANTVNMTLHERTAEFGVMRALGRRGADVFRLAMLESAVLGAIGATLGVGIGALLALAISAIGIPMPPGPGSETGLVASVPLVPSAIVTAFAVGVIGAISASVLPARKAARVPVVDALRHAI